MVPDNDFVQPHVPSPKSLYGFQWN